MSLTERRQVPKPWDVGLSDEDNEAYYTGAREASKLVVEEVLGLQLQVRGAVGALHEAIQLARDFNRGAMTCQEYDRKLADLELAYPKDT